MAHPSVGTRCLEFEVGGSERTRPYVRSGGAIRVRRADLLDARQFEKIDHQRASQRQPHADKLSCDESSRPATG